MGQTREGGTLLVPFESKWYCLRLVSSEGVETDVSFSEVEGAVFPEWSFATDGTVIADHIIHPRAVVLYCNKKGHALDPLSYELLVGRWVLEYPMHEVLAKRLGIAELAD